MWKNQEKNIFSLDFWPKKSLFLYFSNSKSIFFFILNFWFFFNHIWTFFKTLFLVFKNEIVMFLKDIFVFLQPYIFLGVFFSLFWSLWLPCISNFQPAFLLQLFQPSNLFYQTKICALVVLRYGLGQKQPRLVILAT